MRIQVVLTPPLDDIAGKRSLQVELPVPVSTPDWAPLSEPLSTQVTALDLVHHLATLDSRMRTALLDAEGRVLPAWRLFLDGRIVLERGEELVSVPLREGNEVTLLLGLAGGCRSGGQAQESRLSVDPALGRRAERVRREAQVGVP